MRRARALGEARAAGGVGAGQHERELLAAPAARDVALAHGLARARAANACSTSSPAGCPYRSLTCLKSSRSASTTQTLVAEARARARARTRSVSSSAAAVREPGEAVDQRLPLDDAVQPRVLERDDSLRGERRRGLDLVGVEDVGGEHERAEVGRADAQRERDAARRPRRGRRRARARRRGPSTMPPAAPVASTADSTTTWHELLGIVRRDERLAEAGGRLARRGCAPSRARRAAARAARPSG